MIKDRPLTKVELKLISISELFHQQRIEEPYGWKTILINSTIILFFWIYALFEKDFSAIWIAVIVSSIIFWFLWLSIKDFKQNIMKSKKTLTFIEQIRTKNYVKVKEYKCSRAILFEEFEDEGIFHAFEVGENQLYFYWDIHEFGTSYYLPNTHFEIYQDPELPYILGQDMNMIGLPFQPIKIKREIKWELWEVLPTENGIMNISMDSFLDEIELHFKNKKSVEK